jgi:hypothetical protein
MTTRLRILGSYGGALLFVGRLTHSPSGDSTDGGAIPIVLRWWKSLGNLLECEWKCCYVAVIDISDA